MEKQSIMFSQPFIEFVVGSISILGGIVLLLYKRDLIRFGKKEKVVNQLINAKECPAHNDTVLKLSAVHDQQIKNTTLHVQHAIKLEEGRTEFKEVKEAIQLIGLSIAVLLDRSNRAERMKSDGISLG